MSAPNEVVSSQVISARDQLKVNRGDNEQVNWRGFETDDLLFTIAYKSNRVIS